MAVPLMHLWRLWSDSLGMMGTENRPELPLNHLTIVRFSYFTGGTSNFIIVLMLKSNLSSWTRNVITTYCGEFYRKTSNQSLLEFY